MVMRRAKQPITLLLICVLAAVVRTGWDQRAAWPPDQRAPRKLQVWPLACAALMALIPSRAAAPPFSTLLGLTASSSCACRPLVAGFPRGELKSLSFQASRRLMSTLTLEAMPAATLKVFASMISLLLYLGLH
jgi:hypothetical protein